MPEWFPWALEHVPTVSDAGWLMVTTAGFLVIAFIVGRFIVPVVGKMLSDRREAIALADGQVKATMAEVERLRNDYRDRLEHIEDENERRLTAAVAESETLRDQILAEAEVASRAILDRARMDVAQERAKVEARLKSEFAGHVVRAASYAAVRSLTPDDQDRLLDSFIAGVEVRS